MLKQMPQIIGKTMFLRLCYFAHNVESVLMASLNFEACKREVSPLSNHPCMLGQKKRSVGTATTEASAKAETQRSVGILPTNSEYHGRDAQYCQFRLS